MNSLQVKEYYPLIKDKQQYKLSFHSPLGKAFEKQTKTIDEQERKQRDAIMNQNEM